VTTDSVSPDDGDAYPAWDVNQDGQTDIVELLLVVAAMGKPLLSHNPRFDVNADGTVDAQDVVLVAQHLGESAGAAPGRVLLPEHLTPETVLLILNVQIAVGNLLLLMHDTISKKACAEYNGICCAHLSYT